MTDAQSNSDDENVIRIADIMETKYGEKAVIDSHYTAKDVIKYLPWKEYEKEVEEHGSLRGKAESRGTNTKTSELYELFNEMERYGFSSDFSTHVMWDPDAQNGDGAWVIDKNALEEATDFWQYMGYEVETESEVTPNASL
ncbi:MAG: hypothetical protein J07AB43_00650 [Candidatus Nanosalina sp. J07AB43]|jgi:hypothetical protein|nr:MAG: hypothetical protein J07AB43_00650 [Candidatus Nanosalina sp. J07AB43]